MTANTITQFAVNVGLVVLSVSFLLTVWRVIKGPTLPDRVIALDMLVGIVMGFIALIAIRTGFTLYIDIAISLGLVGFLATVAFARFILSRKRREGEDGSPPDGSSEQTTAANGKTSRAINPTALPAPQAGAPALKEAAPKPVRSKSEATKASAAKVKIAKAKAAKKVAAAAEPGKPGAAAAASTAGSRPPRKPAVKNKPVVKKETP
ncbi:MAG TPA: cation:proton antiporter [Pseudorhizobium sp.]|jgi:multisubunit Na+/H+ antiporter MnhF subunit|nr:cation:proton antiporter [Pseudorhizobium sp.]